MRTVRATRYVTAFREGGSVPALVEADDDGLYVVKLSGASQGPKVLLAELVAGELARAVGLPVPELVLVELDAAFGDAEPDPELAEPLGKSAGLNLGLDFLPGSITYDPAAGDLPPVDIASQIVLFDAYVANVDRTARNPNMLHWHDALWLIDHGASLYFHHAWDDASPLLWCDDPFPEIRQHVLLPRAEAMDAACAHLRQRLTDPVLDTVLSKIPDLWLVDGPGGTPEERRSAYGQWLRARRLRLASLAQEVADARA